MSLPLFKFLLSPESRAQLEQERDEAWRLYNLTRPWLAAALLKLARQARATRPHIGPEDLHYDAALVFRYVPELALRLSGGATVRLTQAETDWTVRALTDYELRQRLGHCIQNSSNGSDLPWALLTRTICNGNPVVFGADHLCPGVPGDRDDPMVREQDEIAGIRVVPFTGCWTPAMIGEDFQDRPGRDRPPERPMAVLSAVTFRPSYRALALV